MRTHFGVQWASAPAYLLPIDEDFTFSATLTQNYSAMCDQVMVFLYQDDENWAKFGLENSDSFQQIGGVVTHDGFSDWSTFDLSSDVRSVEIKLHFRGNDCMCEAFLNNKWMQLRIFHVFSSK